MFIINILTYFKNVYIFQYLLISSAFYGTFLIIRKVVFGR